MELKAKLKLDSNFIQKQTESSFWYVSSLNIWWKSEIIY